MAGITAYLFQIRKLRSRKIEWFLSQHGKLTAEFTFTLGLLASNELFFGYIDLLCMVSWIKAT